jgi:methylthioribose-1-phosphate isomerase
VVAPFSTIDLTTPDGDGIPIEQRNPKEISHLGGTQLTPDGAKIWNPAFDITPHRYVTGIVTEHGIIRPPYSETLRAALGSQSRDTHAEPSSEPEPAAPQAHVRPGRIQA